MARSGHIVDELRSFDWMPAGPPGAAVDNAPLGPSCTEPTDRAGRGPEPRRGLRRVLAQIALINQVTFDTTLGAALEGDQGLTLGDVLVADEDDAPGHNVEVAELRAALAAAIERLSARERDVVALYYHDGLTLAEIGEVLGVTESRVCQIHGKAVAQLRRRLVAAEREPA